MFKTKPVSTTLVINTPRTCGSVLVRIPPLGPGAGPAARL